MRTLDADEIVYIVEGKGQVLMGNKFMMYARAALSCS